MTTSRAAELLREPGQPRQATFLELFFDVVYVFTLIQLARGLGQRLDLTGAFQTLVLLLAVWWVWTLMAWITNFYNPQRTQIQLLIVAAMLGGLLMAVALPEAFGKQGPVFAGAYVAIHLGRGLFLILAVRDHQARRTPARVLFWFTLSAGPWIAGAAANGAARAVWWTLAVTLDYTAGAIRYPTPRLGRAPTREWPVAAEHLSERYRQFFIIALGELILTSGLALSGTGFAPGRTAGFVVSFVTAVLLWRIYIYRAGELLPGAITAAADPYRLARSALYAHLFMVAGIVAIAVGDELVIEHPTAHPQPAWIAVILGGPALFLTGRAIFEHTVFARVSRSRVIGLIVLAAAAPAMILGTPLITATTAALTLAAVAASDAARARGHPAQQPSPR